VCRMWGRMLLLLSLLLVVVVDRQADLLNLDCLGQGQVGKNKRMKKYFFLFLGKTVFYLGKNWREDEMKTILPLPIENYLEHALILKVLK